MAPLQRLFAGIFLCLAASGYAQYDGIVGSAGCQAVKLGDARIVAWATGCQVQRGYYDIATDRRRASYGHDSDAIGPATLSTTVHVVSLGDSGVATLTFAEPITNGEGYDFAVFENSFNDTFLELAFVEVSSDGVRFVRFPAVSNTQTDKQVSETGPVDATKLHNLAGKYRIGWGTPFDLEELKDSAGLDVSRITHVRLVDVVGTIDSAYASRDANGHMVNDPYPTPYYSSGFDLSGVAVLRQPLDVRTAAPALCRIYPNPASEQVRIECEGGEAFSVTLRDVTGQLLLSQTAVSGSISLPVRDYPAGLYLLTLTTRQAVITEKIVLRH
ncbi:MAG: T9SS type A sorting domain-containing protein [Bacteroidales bacterium]|nr:T9SS type A sorting domain-containing protein [Bacteroidales bacterium]